MASKNEPRTSIALNIHGAAIYLFLYLPIALLIFFSFNKNPSGTLPVTGLTLEWYRQLGDDYFMLTSFKTSLVVALTAVIFGAGHLLGVRDFPLVVALLFAIVIALPLGIWMFAPLRRRATASIAVVDERRRKDREQLQARLRGEETSSGEEPSAE